MPDSDYNVQSMWRREDKEPKKTPSRFSFKRVREIFTSRTAITLLRGGLIVLGVCVVVGILWFTVIRGWQLLFDDNPKFIVKTVEVIPAKMAAEEQIQRLTRIREGVNIFSLNLPEIRRDFLNRRPEIRDIQIERVMPDTVRIVVIERTPIMRNPRDSRNVIDFEGYVFALASAQDGLPYLHAEEWRTLQPGQHMGEKVIMAMRVLDVLGGQEGQQLRLRIEGVDIRSSLFLILINADRREIALPWSTLNTLSWDAPKEANMIVLEMLQKAAHAMRSPRADGHAWFEVHNTDEIKVYSRDRR